MLTQRVQINMYLSFATASVPKILLRGRSSNIAPSPWGGGKGDEGSLAKYGQWRSQMGAVAVGAPPQTPGQLRRKNVAGGSAPDHGGPLLRK